MRQFYETWCQQLADRPELATLLRELPWSAHLHLLAKIKHPEEREFYLRMSCQQRWPVREVARQIDSALFERAVLHPPKLSTALRELHPGAATVFRDAYVVEFLELPDGHLEADLHQSLLKPVELPADWDPRTDSRLTVWEMVHQLIRVLEAGGESTAAALVAKLGSQAETARELC